MTRLFINHLEDRRNNPQDAKDTKYVESVDAYAKEMGISTDDVMESMVHPELQALYEYLTERPGDKDTIEMFVTHEHYDELLHVPVLQELIRNYEEATHA